MMTIDYYVYYDGACSMGLFSGQVAMLLRWWLLDSPKVQ